MALLAEIKNTRSPLEINGCSLHLLLLATKVFKNKLKLKQMLLLLQEKKQRRNRQHSLLICLLLLQPRRSLRKLMQHHRINTTRWLSNSKQCSRITTASSKHLKLFSIEIKKVETKTRLFSNHCWKPIQMIRFTDLSMLLLPKVSMRSFRAIYHSFLRIWRLLEKDWATEPILNQFIEDLIQTVNSITRTLMPETPLEHGPLSNPAPLPSLSLLGSLNLLKRISRKRKSFLFLRFISTKIILLQLRLRLLALLCRGIHRKKRFFACQCSRSRL